MLKTVKPKKSNSNELHDIALLIAKNANFPQSNCLDGKLKCAFLLFNYGEVFDKSSYSKLAFEILDYAINKELLLNIKNSKVDFLRGITGIGLFSIFMVEDGYFETDLVELLEIIDTEVYKIAEMYSRQNEAVPLYDIMSLILYLHYRNIYSTFPSELHKILGVECLRTLKIILNYFLKNHEYLFHEKWATSKMWNLNINEGERIDIDIAQTLKSTVPLDTSLAQLSKVTKNKLYGDIYKYSLGIRPKSKLHSMFKKHFSSIFEPQKPINLTFSELADLGLAFLPKKSKFLELYWDFLFLENCKSARKLIDPLSKMDGIKYLTKDGTF